MMKRLIPSMMILVCVTSACFAAEGPPSRTTPNLPDGYRLLYDQDFEAPDSLEDFEFTDPEQWKLNKAAGNASLEFSGKSRYKPEVRSPRIIALLSDRQFEEFILEVDLLQTGKEYGHRDMCLFFCFENRSRFYYCHMAKAADNHAHNIFIVDDAPRTKIATKTTAGIDWGRTKWHRVRLVRTSSGTVEIYYDDMSTPIMLAQDTTHALGCIGFGSFDDSGMIDNIRIWGPKMVQEETQFFSRKKR